MRRLVGMGKRAVTSLDAVRDKLRKVAADSKLTQQEIGERMGFAESDARKAVSRLLNPKVDYDPRLSTLIRFATAVGCPLSKLLS